MTARRVVILVCFALAEAALLAPVVGALIPLPRTFGAAGLVGGVWLVLLLMAGTWRLLGRFDLSTGSQYALMAAWLIVLALVAELDLSANARSFSLVFFDMLPGFIAALLVWWRGIALGRSALNLDGAEMRLQLGAILLVIYGVFTLFSRSSALLASILPFLLAALLALPLTHLEYVEHNERGRRVPMSRAWWAWTVGPAILIVCLGVLVLALLAGGNVGDAIAVLFAVALFPAFILVSLIPAAFFQRLAEWLRQLAAGLRSSRFGLGDFGAQQQIDDAAGGGITFSAELNFVIALAIFGALVVALVLLMGRAKREQLRAARPHDDFDSALGKAGQPDSFFDALTSRLGLREWLAALTVRRLYARAVREAGKRGVARADTQTPHDFLPQLSAAFPGRESDARALTDAYIAAHYGEAPDTRAELDGLKQAWERMRQSQRPARAEISSSKAPPA